MAVTRKQNPSNPDTIIFITKTLNHMSIASELTLLNNTKQGIKTAINNKGVSVTNEPFADYPDKIRLIPNGGGWYESNLILFIEGKLKNVDIPSGATKVGHAAMAFYGRLESVTIPNTVTEIGSWAFNDSRSLTSVNIPNTVTSIGEYAFASCTALTSITLPNSLITIGNYAFEGCNHITSMTIPNSVTTIGDYSFKSMSRCGTVTIGTGITSIGIEAFSMCTSLNYVVCNATVPPTLGRNAFSNSNCNIYVPDNSVLDYQVVWSDYASRITPKSQMN